MARFERGELRSLIYSWLMNTKRAGASRKDVAEKFGLKKSPHLTGILNDLVHDGWLAVSETELPNGTNKFIYTAIPE